MAEQSFAGRRWVGGRALARRIAALDPVTDHEELTRLTVEVRYGDALFVHAAYLVAFARQVAVPSIARTVHRGGRGDLIRDVRRRNDHTLVFFGEMLRHGHSHPRGRAAVDRMEAIHRRFRIDHDEKLYTLASLAFEGDRIPDRLGLRPFTDAELLAQYHFWRGVGTRMGLTTPDGPAAFRAWALDYERRHYGYTDGGRAVVDHLFADWRARWFPGRAGAVGDRVLSLLMDDHLRETHRLPAPPRRAEALARPLVRAYLALQAARPHRPGRSWVDHFGSGDIARLDIADYGHRPGA
ncbi:oxygenase MpaB family protein [Nocardia takedensis]|uniref:oxygenase MpaB family protein n=1 Tax=Nocardia takedensis TaxID=259390 RepID=UPI0002E07743|nr:oxygenase MpaB family protein [Nocardia takedensis]